MDGMTTYERYNDISEKCGLSEDIVRRVILAERKSVLESLKKGERATLIGRCVLRPEIRNKIVEDCELKNYIKVKASISSSLMATLEEFGDFVEDDNTIDYSDKIKVRQIESLI